MPRKSQKQVNIYDALDVAEACKILSDGVKFAFFLDDEEFVDLKNENFKFLVTATTSRYSMSRRVLEKCDNYLMNRFFEENNDIF